MVQNWQTGNEAEDLNSLLIVLAEVAPVNQVLLDQAEVLQADKCLYCGRKKEKREYPEAFVRWPTDNYRRMVSTFITSKRKERKNAKEKEIRNSNKQAKLASVTIMNENPKSSEFDPNHLTVDELKKVIAAHEESYKGLTHKPIYQPGSSTSRKRNYQ
uniref:Uncharacterized protein n=1 Tax=Vannella robusta TaxID=1487602 RepID=A0A6U1V1K8_9EUKA|mmetsp:Transcript_21870/g.27902  ORF Transcript_21870/g.27902 Transcript_21870/m.27902 type:complete len:158 (+) Transcript_21870:205-678(+)